MADRYSVFATEGLHLAYLELRNSGSTETFKYIRLASHFLLAIKTESGSKNSGLERKGPWTFENPA